MKFAASFLLSQRASSLAVKQCHNLMLGTKAGQMHTFSRSAYAHALAWQSGVARGVPINSLARSYVLYRAAVCMAQSQVWHGAVRVQRALRKLQAPAVHWRVQHLPRPGVGMKLANVPYSFAIGGDGRSVLQRAGAVDWL